MYSTIFSPAPDLIYANSSTYTRETLNTDDSTSGGKIFNQCSSTSSASSSLATSSGSTAADSTATSDSSHSVNTSSAKSGFSSGAIAGTVLGALGLIAALAGLILLLCRRRRTRASSVRPLEIDPSEVAQYSKSYPPCYTTCHGVTSLSQYP